MTRPLSTAFEMKMVGRLIGKNAISARQLQQEEGVPQTTAILLGCAVACGAVGIARFRWE